VRYAKQKSLPRISSSCSRIRRQDEASGPVRFNGRKRPSSDYFGPQFYDDKEKQQVLEVIETGRPFRWYGPAMNLHEGPHLREGIRARMQCKYCLAVTSGTAALQTAMAALEVGPGDEVILPAWTWHSCYTQ